MDLKRHLVEQKVTVFQPGLVVLNKLYQKHSQGY